MEKYYEKYKLLILAVTLVGVYIPTIEKIYGEKYNVKALKLVFIFPAVSMSLFLFSMVKYVIFDDDEPGNKVYGYTLLIFSVFMNFTLHEFNYRKNSFIRLFESWDIMFQEDLFNEDREELLRNCRKKTNRWLKVCGSSSAIYCLFYYLPQYFSPEKKLKHPTGFPYKHQTPDFELLNTLILFSATFGFTLVVVFDSAMMALLSVEETQFMHLKKSLGRIIDIVSVNDSGKIFIHSEEITETNDGQQKMKRTFEQVENQLKIWLNNHRQVLSLHNEFQRVYSISLAVKFSFFVLIICLIFFLTLAGKFNIVDIIVAFTLCFINYIVFYVNIMYADSIAELSDTIFEDAFEKGWYTYPRCLQTVFHIIQMRSCRPVCFLAFKKYTLSSSTFLSILISAYSMFTFLLQTNKKNIKIMDMGLSSRWL